MSGESCLERMKEVVLCKGRVRAGPAGRGVGGTPRLLLCNRNSCMRNADIDNNIVGCMG